MQLEAMTSEHVINKKVPKERKLNYVQANIID